MNPRIASLEKMIDGPRDGALLRYSLGNEYWHAGDLAAAENAFRAAVDRDNRYSAAWKALGKVLGEAGKRAEALAAFERGVAVAQERGDIQAAKEMNVFARRLRKPAGEAAD
jgi:Tfp pilus assembly protein PilF